MKRVEEQLIEVTTTVNHYDNLKSLITTRGDKVYKGKYNKVMAKVWRELDTVGIHGRYGVDDLFNMIENRIMFPCKMESFIKSNPVNGVVIEDMTVDTGEDKEEKKEKVKYGRVFIHSKIILIDVDKYMGDMDAEYTKGLRNLSIGYIHSPSGDNCYRLVFILDRYITDYNFYKIMHGLICNMLKDYDFVSCIDTSNSSPLALVRLGRGYRYHNKQARVPYSLYIDDIQKELENKYATQYMSEDSEYKSGIITTDIEIHERLKFMGDKETDYDTWFAMVQAIRSELGEDQQAWEAVRIASKDRNDGDFENEVQSIFNNNEVKYTWGMFIKISNSYGYRPSYEVTEARRSAAIEAGMLKENYTHIIKDTKKANIVKYIKPKMIIDMLNGSDTTLLESPTNSGKSTGIIKAFKTLTKESSKNIFILTVPYTSIIDNLLSDDKDNEIAGYYASKEDDEFYNAMSTALMQDKKQIFITTYNATHKLVKLILHHIPDANMRIVADEVHEWVIAYNYRDEAINDLASVLPMIRIGLSGTSYPVDTSSIFNKKVILERKNNKINADEYNVYTFKKDGYDSLLSTINAMYKKLTNGDKVLLFLDNIEDGLLLSNLAKERLPNLRTAQINADTKYTNEIYKELVSKHTFPENIDLIIATRFLSTGISINNNYNSHIYILSGHVERLNFM
ncbi:DEAD/DEAH box helicase family protein [Viridibacillus sp. NPDC096237]|uniref:DEAD/DEAH box helicase family protein n=1 Tax=Viridibacillus sp. NPDC096237 TaxID=3390721 RepID=UPI003D02AE7B